MDLTDPRDIYYKSPEEDSHTNLRAQRATRYIARHDIATYIDGIDRAQINLALYTYMKCQKQHVTEGYLFATYIMNNHIIFRTLSGGKLKTSEFKFGDQKIHSIYQVRQIRAAISP